MKSCPNCGAPIQSEQCIYCGTKFYEEKPTVNYSYGVSMKEATKSMEKFSKMLYGAV